MHPAWRAHRDALVARAEGRVLELRLANGSNDGAYDTILSIGTLTQRPDDIDRVKQMLAPGGRLLFIEPDADGDLTGRLWARGYSLIDVHRFRVPRAGFRQRRWVSGCARIRRDRQEPT